MYAFACSGCGSSVRFEDLACGQCGDALGYRPDRLDVVSESAADRPFDGWHRCAEVSWGCNWLVHDDNEYAGCEACRLNRKVPPRSDTIAWEQLAEAAKAKRRLVHQLKDRRLPIVSYHERPDGGLAFDLLSSQSGDGPVMIGHANGVISIDLAESSDQHRESVRVWLDESYRTMLGHFRHEIGHYYWQVLVPGTKWEEPFRELFGDERESYSEALQRHYARDPGRPLDPEFISPYASSHPWEDFAEVWAHYLHITDTLRTARSNGLLTQRTVGGSAVRAQIDVAPEQVGEVLQLWARFAWVFNELNRAMGKGDAYPFVIAEPVAQKLRFVHELVRDAVVAHSGSEGG